MMKRASHDVLRVSRLLDLIKDHCTNAQIHGLLKPAKDEMSDLRISGNNDALMENLKAAIQRGAIQFDEAYQLLCESEEYKNQHIFFYKAKQPDTRKYCDDPDQVAAQIFGARWSEENFPHLFVELTGTEWTDFRTWGVGAAGADPYVWVAKLNMGVIRKTRTGTERPDDATVKEVYRLDPAREILVAAWRTSGVLEIRVPPEDSKKLVLSSRAEIWKKLNGALSEELFRPLDLTVACSKLIDRYDPKSQLYRLSAALCMDAHRASAVFSPPSGDEDLLSSAAFQNARKMFESCRELGIFWKMAEELHGSSGELRCVVGKHGVNHLSISKGPAKGIEYVTARLRQLSR
jgi:hypothetical protein